MFGAHLSNATQRKQGGNKKQGVGSSDKSSSNSTSAQVDNVFSFLKVAEALDEEGMGQRLQYTDFFNGKITHPHKKLLEKGEVPIQYSARAGGALPRDMMMQFWLTCGSFLLSDEGITRIVAEAAKGNQPLHFAAIEYQRDVMEFNFGIERDWGCEQIGRVSIDFPNDKELHKGAGAFMKVAMYSYIEQLKMRSKLRNSPLRTTRSLTRTDILEFFEACNAAMSLDSTKATLRNVWSRSPKKEIKDVGAATIKVQHSILELLGVTKEYGVQCLNEVMQAHSGDSELYEKFQSFRMCAEMGTESATMSDAEIANMLKEVPAYMHDVPHIYFIQKQKMAMDIEKQNMAQRNHLPSPESPQGQALAQQQQRLLEYINTDSGQEKIQRISNKIRSAQAAVGATATDWDTEQCAAYFTKFSADPIVAELKECGGDMLRRIDTFDNLSDKSVQDMMTMQAVFARDARSGAALINKLREDPEAVGVASAMQSVSAMLKLGTVAKGENIQMPANMLGYNAQPRSGGMSHDHSHSHGHSHDHDHVHGPNCNHGPPAKVAPDVTKGKADKIDRD